LALETETAAVDVLGFGFVASRAVRLGRESKGIGGGVAASGFERLGMDGGSSLFIPNDNADLLGVDGGRGGGSFRRG